MHVCYWQFSPVWIASVNNHAYLEDNICVIRLVKLPFPNI